MAYSTGGLIEASDYNGFRNTINKIIGMGTDGGGSGGNYGYGQTNIISAVTGGSDSVTATQWTNLFTRLRSTMNHQGSSLTLGASNPATGDLVAIRSGLTADLSTADTNRLTAAAGSLASPVNITNVNGTARTAAWNSTINHVFTVTFAASGTAPSGAAAQDAARFFFNTGGYIQISLSGANGSSSQDTAWTNLLSAMGTIRFGGNGTTKSGGSGSTSILTTSTGYYQLGTTDTVVFRQFDTTANYTANLVEIKVKTDTITDPNSRGGRGSVLTFTVTLNDAHTNAFFDTVNLDVTSNVSLVGHNTTFLNNIAWTATGATTTAWA